MAARAKKSPPFQVPQPEAKIASVAGTPAHDFLVAASLAARIISKSKVARWVDLNDGQVEVATDLRITPAQAEIIFAHEHVVRSIFIKQKGATNGETQYPAICPECSQWFVITSTGSLPSKCSLTQGCTGTPIKSSLSSAAKPPEDAKTDEPHTTTS